MVRNNKETGITQTLAAFASNVNYEDLSPDVVDWAKYLCLDFAGVTLNGSTIAGPVSISSAEADANAAGIRKYAPFIYDDGTSQFLMVKKA